LRSYYIATTSWLAAATCFYNNKPLTFGLANRAGAERMFFRRAIATGGNGGPTGLLLRRCVRLAFILDSIAASRAVLAVALKAVCYCR